MLDYPTTGLTGVEKLANKGRPFGYAGLDANGKLLAAQGGGIGPTGATGATGSTGATGPAGPAGVQLFNVKTYGAVGDGVADDRAALASADAAAVAVGGATYLPPGTY